MVFKIMSSSVNREIDFNEAYITYNELHFSGWPNNIVHPPSGWIYIVYGSVILVHRNIQVTTIIIGDIQLPQGLEF